MSKKYIQNGALIPAEDEQIITDLAAYLSVSLPGPAFTLV